MPAIPTANIRETMLQVISDLQPKGPLDGSLQQTGVLMEMQKRLGITRNDDLELAILTIWNDLFRTGLLSWGHNLNNPDRPFFHVTERGRKILQQLSRDPGNPAGYMNHLHSLGQLNAVAASYLGEGLECFTAGLHKAAAVMLGAAAESTILELRDVIIVKLDIQEYVAPKALSDWRVKIVLDAINDFLTSKNSTMPHDLCAEFESYWPAFTQQIRAARNDAGHPTTVDPVTPDGVHASFLLFPELVRLSTRLKSWVENGLK